MNRNFWFNIYLMMGILMGVVVEIINGLNENVVGIGLVIYILVMINFYQIFGRTK